MPLMRAATVVVYAGAYLFVLFFAVCLATGLYYLAELVEEYTRLTRKVISYVIKFVIALHVILLVVDRLPMISIGVGIASHVVYHRLLKTFPYISLTAPDFLGSICLLILSHVVWIRFFYTDPRCAYVTMEWLFGFMLVMVWMVPFAFFISLAANESVLPGSGGLGGYHGFGSGDFSSRGDDASASAPPRQKGKRTRSSILGFLNFLRSKRDEVLPMVSRSIPSSRRVD
ncbi:uncharacterized protein [Physcomitrium patens]|uniref:Transmembrane adaptor Erv26 n=1 Tax=Physcomitrium patens TaxID=3218 RepID=A0A2K1KJX7_PHYPA|nr:protein TEX261-like [Physcomitrium patens]PNR54063.1 hypothetical protein PHYPA_007739 [Physcomitrium patens]|eukprot:XP_024375091.1 protein TEX261-like [Physcomitrella patens]